LFTGLTREILHQQVGRDKNDPLNGYAYWTHPAFDDRTLLRLREGLYAMYILLAAKGITLFGTLHRSVHDSDALKFFTAVEFGRTGYQTIPANSPVTVEAPLEIIDNYEITVAIEYDALSIVVQPRK